MHNNKTKICKYKKKYKKLLQNMYFSIAIKCSVLNHIIQQEVSVIKLGLIPQQDRVNLQCSDLKLTHHHATVDLRTSGVVKKTVMLRA